MTTIRQRNGHLPHRHHSRLSLNMRRQAFAFARMLNALPAGTYKVTVIRAGHSFRFESIGERATEKIGAKGPLDKE